MHLNSVAFQSFLLFKFEILEEQASNQRTGLKQRVTISSSSFTYFKIIRVKSQLQRMVNHSLVLLQYYQYVMCSMYLVLLQPLGQVNTSQDAQVNTPFMIAAPSRYHVFRLLSTVLKHITITSEQEDTVNGTYEIIFYCVHRGSGTTNKQTPMGVAYIRRS